MKIMRKFIRIIRRSWSHYKLVLLGIIIFIFSYWLLSLCLKQFEISQLKKSEAEFISKLDSFFMGNDMVGYFVGKGDHVFLYPNKIKAFTKDSVLMSINTELAIPVHDTETYFVYKRFPNNTVLSSNIVIQAIMSNDDKSYEIQDSLAKEELKSRIILVNKDTLIERFNNIKSRFHQWGISKFSNDSIGTVFYVARNTNSSTSFYKSKMYPEAGYGMINIYAKTHNKFWLLSVIALVLSFYASYIITNHFSKKRKNKGEEWKK